MSTSINTIESYTQSNHCLVCASEKNIFLKRLNDSYKHILSRGNLEQFLEVGCNYNPGQLFKDKISYGVGNVAVRSGNVWCAM